MFAARREVTAILAGESAKLAPGGLLPVHEGSYRPSRLQLAALLALLMGAALFSVLLSAPGSQSRRSPAKPVHQNPLGSIPPLFVKNRGQVDHRAGYYLQGHDASVFFTRRGLALSLVGPQHAKRRYGLHLDFLGAGAGVKPVGQARTRAVTSYFKGRPADWKTNVPTYSKVAYPNLWPGIDLVYSGEGAKLKYSFRVKPGADPANIHLGWRGASGLAVDGAGQLKVSTPARTLADAAPNTYQRIGGRRVAVKSSYALGARKTYGFRIGGYDRSQPLVIDPAVLVYSGFIGGTGDESGGNVALDSAKNLYVIGDTTSSDFPATVGPDTSFNDTSGLTDAFVAKVNPSGTGLIYAGFIGGSKRDTPFNIAVDGAGAAYVGGSTSSTEADGFPVKVGPDLTYNGGGQDAWVAKVKPDGTGLDYAGYVGGAGPGDPSGNNEQANGIAVDGTGHAYLSGFTHSDQTTFPNGQGFGTIPGYKQTFGGFLDAFVVKVKTDGSGLDYATYLGGGGADAGTGIRVDAGGNAYVNVFTGSNQNPKGPMNPFGGFAVTPGSFDTTYNGPPGSPAPNDIAAIKLNPSGTALVYSTYIGGAGSEQPLGNAIDSSGNDYITGQTTSDETTFPNGQGFGSIPGFDHVLNGGPSSVNPTPTDTFVVKLNATGSNLDYATYIGGTGNEQSIGIDLDSTGAAYVSGTTSSADGSFPATNGPGSTYNGGETDAFVAKLNPFGTGLDYAGFLGGSRNDNAIGMKVDGDGNAYVAGTTNSDQSTFPVKGGPSLTKSGPFGSTDAFVAKIAVAPPQTTTSQPPASGGLTTSGSTADKTAPGVSRYRVTNSPFVVSGAKTPTFGVAARKKHKKGTTFRYTLSEAATVKIVISQRASGRRKAKKCVAPTKKLRKAKKCTRIFTRGTLVRLSKAGANSVPFSGRIGSNALRPGSYSATITATDAARNTSGPKTISFTIVKR